LKFERMLQHKVAAGLTVHDLHHARVVCRAVRNLHTHRMRISWKVPTQARLNKPILTGGLRSDSPRKTYWWTGQNDIFAAGRGVRRRFRPFTKLPRETKRIFERIR
jgi:hypothetical protein